MKIIKKTNSPYYYFNYVINNDISSINLYINKYLNKKEIMKMNDNILFLNNFEKYILIEFKFCFISIFLI